MKFTIVTVCYNAGKILEKTITSVLSQTYRNIEYIIIDGASSDNTKEVLEKYADKIDIIISEPDNGLYDAMNKAIDIATGDYINFMNAGDYFSDDYVLESVANQINEDEDDVVYGDSTMIFGHGKTIFSKATDPVSLIGKRPIYRHNASFTRTSLHKKFPFDLSKANEFKYALDYNHIFNIWSKGAIFKKVNVDVVTWIKDGVSDQPIQNVKVCYKISHQFRRPSSKERFVYIFDLLKASRRELLKLLSSPIQ